MNITNNFLKRITDIFHKLPNMQGKKHSMTEEQLRTALIEGEKSGIVESNERTMVEGVFYLGDRPVKAFMKHRSEIIWFDINEDPESISSRALENRIQRFFPVTDGKPDEIIGAVYLDDILIDKLIGPSKGLRAIMREAYFVPQTMPALKAFESFKKANAGYIFVMDEYGGFSGMLSIKDLMEEIVGELADSHNETEPIVIQDSTSWLADGGTSIDDIGKVLSLPDLAKEHPNYHTLAGFILSLAGVLPHNGDSFTYKDFSFTITAMDGNRIDKVVVKKVMGEDIAGESLVKK